MTQQQRQRPTRDLEEGKTLVAATREPSVKIQETGDSQPTLETSL